ncbi:MAG: hypothetical protein ACEPOV_09345 [Hyphomicrobiales bacterium]
MKKNFKQLFLVQYILGHFIPLIIGGGIYLFFRGKNLMMFHYLKYFNLRNFIDTLRESYTQDLNLPNWVIYSLPDGLFIYSYINLILFLWRNVIFKDSLIWLIIMPVVILLYEFGQLWGYVSGTFDLMDLFFYFIGIALPFLIYQRLIIIKSKRR